MTVAFDAHRPDGVEPVVVPVVVIDGRPIGPGHPPWLVAELSGNHGGQLDRALRLIDAAKAAGADAVKLQTYTADTLTLDHDGPGFRIEGGLWAGRRLHDLYREAATPWVWHERLFAHARDLGLTVFSSPFDESAVTLLEQLDAPAFKIASFELVDPALIRRAAASGRPLILSTGMATLGEIEAAVEVAQAALATAPTATVPVHIPPWRPRCTEGSNKRWPVPDEGGCERLPASSGGVILLHCVSGYPTPPEESHLRTLPHLAAAFGVPVGLSDHSPGLAVPVAAVALGAAMIEKHFTLARAEGGVDAAFSLEPEEFRAMAAACRTAFAALGRVEYGLKPSEAGGRAFRRSLYVVADMAAGERFTAQTVRSIRPGAGLAPRFLPEVLGRRAARPIGRGTPLAWNLVAGDGE